MPHVPGTYLISEAFTADGASAYVVFRAQQWNPKGVGLLMGTLPCAAVPERALAEAFVTRLEGADAEIVRAMRERRLDDVPGLIAACLAAARREHRLIRATSATPPTPPAATATVDAAASSAALQRRLTAVLDEADAVQATVPSVLPSPAPARAPAPARTPVGRA